MKEILEIMFAFGFLLMGGICAVAFFVTLILGSLGQAFACMIVMFLSFTICAVLIERN